jgi:hypothetical protein
MVRGDFREAIFFDDGDGKMFPEALAEACKHTVDESAAFSGKALIFSMRAPPAAPKKSSRRVSDIVNLQPMAGASGLQ